ncbi:hypothetical protein BGW41_007172 [Actinomortierella wolfii]|nr:hypothetical protein BGW41_007172 [Actinomortierella wolfii]
MNYAGDFFTVGEHWSFKKARDKIKRFMNHAVRSNFEVTVFLDAFISTEESIAKWRGRREEEVLVCKRNMPQSLNTLIGELFKKAGARIAYSTTADNDDTLAAHASADRAAVLSRDKDFLRYIDSKYELYEDFVLKQGFLHLIPRRARPIRYPPTPRELISPPPPTRDSDPGFITLPEYFLRGSPSPLTRICGNLHRTIRPLRQAYYASLEIGAKPIPEEFPEYEVGKGVVWHREDVYPDSKHLKLLSDPKAAYTFFFSDIRRPARVTNRDWENHVYATYAVVFEICALYSNTSLFDMLVQHAKRPPPAGARQKPAPPACTA